MASKDVQLKEDKVSVIGCGYFGSTWIMVYVRAGYLVSVYDINRENMDTALEWVKKELHQLEDSAEGKTGVGAEQQFERITASATLQDCVQGSILIQECIPDNLEKKRELLGNIDRYAQDDAIIVTLSSGELPSLLSEKLKHTHNFAVVHPLTPPLFVKSAEVIPAPWTDAKAIARLTDILEGLGFLPIVSRKEIYGYVANRIQNCLMAECYQLVKGGYCDVIDCDTGITEGLGLWYSFMGLFEAEHINANDRTSHTTAFDEPVEEHNSFINSRGFVDLCTRFGNGCYEVQKTFLPPVRMEGPALRSMHNSLCESVPLETIDEQRRLRHKKLSALQNMKNKLDVSDPWRP